ncbi:hypothetical protein QQX98_012185 [Neonectria punicea]|uniref:Uncharacterized protein n=1 Tax=Neonectria punicea TaxID=979145 RepID=A0ABR1GK24_9HYPO
MKLSSTQATTGPNEEALKRQGTVCDSLVDFTMRKILEDGVERAKQWLEKSRPQVTREEFLAPGQPGCPDPVFDEHWSQEDENRLQKRWNESVNKNVYQQMAREPCIKAVVDNLSDSDRSLRSLWRTCIRMMRIDPFSLLTWELRVADRTEMDLDGEMVPGPMWSAEVCDLLSLLIAHPFFSCALPDEKLRFYLKWARICRTDDRHPLKSKDFTPCPIVRRLIRTPRPGKQPWRKVHETFRLAYWEKYGGYTVESDVLHAIAESTIPRPGSIGPGGEDDLRAGDIAQVLTALNRLSSYGFANSVNPSVALGMAWGAQGGSDYPVDDEQFREVVGNCWLADQRRNKKLLRSIPDDELVGWAYYDLPETDVDLDMDLDNESSYSSERSDAPDQVNDAECLGNGSLHDEDEEGHNSLHDEDDEGHNSLHDEDDEGHYDEEGLTDDDSSDHESLQVCPRCSRSYHRDEYVTRAGKTKRFCHGCTRATQSLVSTSQALAEPAPTGPNDPFVSRQKTDLSIRLRSAPELDSEGQILQLIDDLDKEFTVVPEPQGGARLDL